MREKVGKSRNAVFFQWFVAPEGRKVGSLKRRVRSQLARGEMKNCTPMWREAHFEVKMYKTHHVRTTFGSWDVEKVHAIVARSTFRSQNVQNTSASDHFWKLRCRKSACRCGAKHISKSKCTKHISFGPLLEVAMSKKCTPLWREAHFQVKIYKPLGVRTLLEVEMSKKCTPLWREAHFQVKMFKALGVCDHFWRFRCRKSAYRCGAKHISKSKCTKHLGFGPLLEVQMSLRFAFTRLQYITLHYTPLCYITLHYTPLHYNYNYDYTTTLHYTTLHYTKLHYTTLHYITLHSTTLNYTTLHYITLQSTTVHYATLPSTTLHYTTLHYTTTITTQLHSTTVHYPKLRYTTLHYIPLQSTTPHYITLHYITLNDTAPQIDR